MPHPTDLDLTAKEVFELASPDAVTAFLAKLGYDTSDRALLTPEAVGLSVSCSNRSSRSSASTPPSTAPARPTRPSRTTS